MSAPVEPRDRAASTEGTVFPPLSEVVVLGASGFIGGRIADYLRAERGLRVSGYGSRDCNLLDAARVAEVFASVTSGTSIVFCSAITRTADDSFDALVRNVTMAENVADALPVGGPRSLIFFSSVDVYGRPPERLPLTEASRLAPSDYYGISKSASEMLLQLRLRARCPVTVLRIPGIYGRGDRGRSVVGTFLQRILGGETVAVGGDGTSRRDYVEVGDVCRIVERFLDRPCDAIVNVATGTTVSIRELVALIGEVVGVRPTIEYRGGSGGNWDLAFSIERLRQLCPDVEFTDLADGIREYADWLRAGRPMPDGNGSTGG